MTCRRVCRRCLRRAEARSAGGGYGRGCRHGTVRNRCKASGRRDVLVAKTVLSGDLRLSGPGFAAASGPVGAACVLFRRESLNAWPWALGAGASMAFRAVSSEAITLLSATRSLRGVLLKRCGERAYRCVDSFPLRPLMRDEGRASVVHEDLAVEPLSLPRGKWAEKTHGASGEFV